MTSKAAGRRRMGGDSASLQSYSRVGSNSIAMASDRQDPAAPKSTDTQFSSGHWPNLLRNQRIGFKARGKPAAASGRLCGSPLQSGD